MKNETLQDIENKMQKAINSHNLERDKLFVVALKSPEDDFSLSLCSLEDNQYNIIGNFNDLNQVKIGNNFREFYQNLKNSEGQEITNILGNTKSAKFVKTKFLDLQKEIKKVNENQFQQKKRVRPK